MNPTIITARVTDQHLQLVNVPLIASGGVDVIQVRFEFCGLWEGCGKTAVFYRNPKDVYHVPIADGLATVPWEVLVDEGHFYFGVFGSASNRRPTEVVKVKVVKGAITTATADPQEPTPNIYEQLLAAYGVTEARVDNLIAPKDPVTPSGLDTFTITDGDDSGQMTIVLTSNGVNGICKVRLFGIGTGAGDAFYSSVHRVPLKFVPLGDVTLQGSDSANGEPIEYEVLMYVADVLLDEGVALVEASVITNEKGHHSITGVLETYYPVMYPTLPELQDARVDAGGTVHGSAGDAVRAVSAALENAAEADYVTDAIDSLNEQGIALHNEEYVWGDIMKDFAFSGTAGKKYIFRINSMDNANTNACVVYFRRSDQAQSEYVNQTLFPNIGETYIVTANGDFDTIRFYMKYDVAPTDNHISVSFGAYPYLWQLEDNLTGVYTGTVHISPQDLSKIQKAQARANIGAVSVDDVMEIINNHTDDGGDEDDALRTEEYEWVLAKDFDFSGTAGKKYVFRINSIGDENTQYRIVYFMKDGKDVDSYGSGTIPVNTGELYTKEVRNDFDAIRFWIKYATTPTNKHISVSFGEYVEPSEDEPTEDVTVQPSYSLLQGYTENVYCIGDSLSAGYVGADDAGGAYLSYYSYPYFLGKLMNTNTTAYAQAGDTASQAWTRHETQIRDITNSIVVIWLGTNAGLTNTVATDCVGDDPAAYAANNTGDYGRMIKTLTDNGNKVVLAHIFTLGGSIGAATTNAAITALAERFNCKLIELSSDEINDFKNAKYHTSKDGTHFSCMGYSYVANVFYGKMNRLALADPQWFCIKRNK